MRNKFFIGGDIGDKKMTWVKWDKCPASKQDSGLGIGSIYGLLFKWVWRFLNARLDLWVQVIQCIHGLDGCVNSASNSSLKRNTWGAILYSINNLKQKGIDHISFCSHKVGNGIYSRFWSDIWCGERPLKATFPRIYLIDSDKNWNIGSRVCLNDSSSVLRRSPQGGVELNHFYDLLNIIRGISLKNQRDSWQWSMDSAKGYTVASARSLIDSAILETGSEATQ
ncbi:hypothetical protein Tco_0987960 [Tanacetum coccineum]|uniref:RNA-directed DNA polymerase, eukaryota, reverse transcriptase zinc-binding domain protein n=1 Tax=Tanacetum coccineum TaxID=301880 RepID=A0ABQ5EPN0_9ASTR